MCDIEKFFLRVATKASLRVERRGCEVKLFSRTEIDAVEIHFASVTRGLAGENGTLQLHGDLDVVLVVVASRELECLSEHDGVDAQRIVLELRVVAVEGATRMRS